MLEVQHCFCSVPYRLLSFCVPCVVCGVYVFYTMCDTVLCAMPLAGLPQNHGGSKVLPQNNGFFYDKGLKLCKVQSGWGACK